MSQHRNTITYPIRLDDHPALHKCVNDPSYRVMVFCAGDTSGMQDVAFPHQSELKVNGGEVKANLRGLKNKPGSTRPVDITKALRLRPKYTNNVEFTYALTSKVSTVDKRCYNHSLTANLEFLPCDTCLQDNICRTACGAHCQWQEDID